MYRKWIAGLILLVVTSCWCGAQASADGECTQAEQNAARDVARAFLAKMRDERSVAPLRAQYLSRSCEPLFTALFDVDAKLRSGMDCAVANKYGDASFDFFYLLVEIGLSSKTWPIEVFDPVQVFPPELAREFNDLRTLRELFEMNTKLNVTSREQLDHLVRDLETFNKAARQYLDDNPEAVVRAASRRAELEQKLSAWTDCTTSDRAGYFGLPKGRLIICISDGLFVLAVVHEDGGFKIVRAIAEGD